MSKAMRTSALCICLAAVGGVGESASQSLKGVDYLLQQLDDPKSTHIFVAAHRGGWERDYEHRAPENSIANIDKAVRMQFDVYETDVRQTVDGTFVIMHDETVDRTTNGSGRVSQMTFADLRRLQLKYANGKLSGYQVPTFDDFLDRGKGRILFKVDYQAKLESFPQIVHLVQKHEMLPHVFFRFTWSEETAGALEKMIDAGMPYHANLLLFRVRTAEEVRAAVARFHPSVIEVIEQRRALQLTRKAAVKLHMTAVVQWVDRRELTRQAARAVRAGRAAGLVVVTRATGGPGQWQRLIDRGFRMFHTEQPERMTVWLRGRGLHH